MWKGPSYMGKLFDSGFQFLPFNRFRCCNMFWTLYSLLQLKFGCSTSEDHQFVRGIPIYTISQVLDKIISGANGPPLLINGVKRPMPLVRILEVELYPTLLSKARSFGLNDDWVQVCFQNFFFLFSTYKISPISNSWDRRPNYRCQMNTIHP